jgi:hypothetical protein
MRGMAYIDYRYVVPMGLLMGLQFFSHDAGADTISLVFTFAWIMVLIVWGKRLRSLLPQGSKPLVYFGQLLWSWLLAALIAVVIYMGLLVAVRWR